MGLSIPRPACVRGPIDISIAAVSTALAAGSAREWARMRRVLHGAHAAWTATALVLLALLIGVRWLRYAPWSGVAPLDGWLRELMVLDVQAFMWPWVYTTLKLRILVVLAVVLVIGLHRRLPGLLVARAEGVWALTPLARSVLVGGMVWLHYLFDLNATVGAVCASSLLLLWVTTGRPRGLVVPLWIAFVAAALASAGDVVDRLAVVVWVLVLLGAQRAGATRVAGRDLALLQLAAVIPINLLSVVLPLLVPLHGGRFIGAGLAYGFCEVPGRGSVYATIPVCDSVDAEYEDCQDGRVVEYDRATAVPLASVRYLSPDFHGRLELIECLADEVHVAVQAAVIHGEAILQSVLAFPVANPSTFNPMVAGKGVGITIAYDRAHEALFYTGEFTHRLVRYDRRTQRLDDVASADLARRWVQPVLLGSHTGSSIVYTHSIHPVRNRLYLAEWMQGRYAYAIDLDSLAVVKRYDVGGGGALGITVDPERDRLFVSSVWGLDVFDLTTDRRIARRRIGTGNRPVIVDAARNRLYLSSTVEGKIYVLDRDTFAVVGQIPIGLGTRFPHLSLDGRTLFASSVAAHYAWDVDQLP